MIKNRNNTKKRIMGKIVIRFLNARISSDKKSFFVEL